MTAFAQDYVTQPSPAEPALSLPEAARDVCVRELKVVDFRNLASTDLEIGPRGIAVIGPNGQGKTNLLEAIHYLHVLRSVRGARDVDLVRFGASGFHIAARMEGAANDEVRVGFQRAGKRKKVVLDGVEPERLADSLGAVPSVMFSPRDVELVTGPPIERRRYLDIALAITSRRYLAALQRYRAALVRRNASLREALRGGHGPARATVWEPALAESGAILWTERVRWTQWAASRYAELCDLIGEREPAALRYASALYPAGDTPPDPEDVRARLAQAFARDRDSDLRRGLTHSGPHRDDLTLMLGAHSLRAFGSAGQQRTAAISLRLLERETLIDRTARSPLVLLDDPFAELDADRTRRILHVLADARMGQTVLAVPRPNDIPAEYTSLARYGIRDGVLDA